MMANCKHNILAIILFCMAATGVAWAGDPALSGGQERILDGHRFLPSIYVNAPWVGTAFQNHTGGGIAVGLKTPFTNLDGDELFVLEGDVFYASLGVGFQQRLGDRIALGASFAGQVRTGSTTQSLVAEGANVDRAMNLWFKYRVLRNENSQLAVGLDWDYDKTIIVTPQEFARGIINDRDLDTASLLHSIKNWTAVLTLDYAYAFSPTYGLRADGRVGLYEEPLTPGVSKATHRIGVLAEMDLRPKSGLPLGLTLGRTQGFPSGDPKAGLSGTLLGLWYTGQKAFVVGVETGYMTLPVVDSDVKVDAMFGVFTIRYYF